MITKEAVMAALARVLDPELGINIVDLGLIYDVAITDDAVVVKMTLTTPGCPLHSHLTQAAQKEVEKLEGVTSARVDMVWDPPWTPERMAQSLKEKFGVSRP